MNKISNNINKLGLDAYTKLKVIGKGSYGEVWLVQHRRDKKQVIRKLIVDDLDKWRNGRK